jgi:fermentation-respiration switch protein FrsA (DUF1100 family)
MADRHDVTFTASDGTVLAGWLYRPDTDGPWPAITMAHGFGATREHGLDDCGRAFCAAGFAVLAHDHRGFGTSGGHPAGQPFGLRDVSGVRCKHQRTMTWPIHDRSIRELNKSKDWRLTNDQPPYAPHDLTTGCYGNNAEYEDSPATVQPVLFGGHG